MSAHGQRWIGVLAIEGVPTEGADGRLIEPEAITWTDRPMPLPLLHRPEAGDPEFMTVCGSIDHVQRVGSELRASGHYWGPRVPDHTQQPVAVQVLIDSEHVGNERVTLRAGRLLGATLVDHALWPEVYITIGDGGADD